MGEGRIKLQTGDFNSMHVEAQPDGSQVITLAKDGEDVTYRLHVRNLYRKNEEILSDEELPK